MVPSCSLPTSLVSLPTSGRCPERSDGRARFHYQTLTLFQRGKTPQPSQVGELWLARKRWPNESRMKLSGSFRNDVWPFITEMAQVLPEERDYPGRTSPEVTFSVHLQNKLDRLHVLLQATCQGKPNIRFQGCSFFHIRWEGPT